MKAFVILRRAGCRADHFAGCVQVCRTLRKAEEWRNIQLYPEHYEITEWDY